MDPPRAKGQRQASGGQNCGADPEGDLQKGGQGALLGPARQGPQLHVQGLSLGGRDQVFEGPTHSVTVTNEN